MKQLETRFRQFPNRDWHTLLTDSARCAEQSHTHSVRARSQPDGVQRASRAMSLVQVGELSAAPQALEGAALAPGSLATLRILTDPERRPPVPREAVSDRVSFSAPPPS